jgi:hypothetical protein
MQEHLWLDEVRCYKCGFETWGSMAFADHVQAVFDLDVDLVIGTRQCRQFCSGVMLYVTAIEYIFP